MAFPAGWPPRAASGVRSIRYFITGNVTTQAFSDLGLLFSTSQTSHTPLPVVIAGSTNSVAIPATPAGTGSGDKADYDAALAAPAPVAMLWASTIRIINDGGIAIEFSFDGTNVHGVVKAGERMEYRRRYEAGIALRLAAPGTTAYRVEAW